MHIKCGKCGKYHDSVTEVRACHDGTLQTRQEPATGGVQVVYVDAEPTGKQLWKIKNLGGQATPNMTRLQASELIEELLGRKEKPVPEPQVQPAVDRHGYPTTTKVPMTFLQALPDGRYAVQMDSTVPHTFFMVTRPKSGRFAGTIKIQTQHGENFELCMVIWPKGNLTFYRAGYEDDLLLLVVDPTGAKTTYGQIKKRCGQCGKELTDPRSRWYGIGPECEKRNEGIIIAVNETKGVFQHEGV